MKECKYCKSEIPEDAKVCPVCRKTVSVSIPLAIVVIFIAVLLINYVIYPLLTSGTMQSVNKTEEKNYAELIEHQKTSDTAFTYIEGKLKNYSNNDYSVVSINFIAYDEYGNNIGDCFDNIVDFKSGTIKEFKATCLTDGKEVYNYEFDYISE